MPEAGTIAAITKLSDQVGAQTSETRRILEGLAQRRADIEDALQELKDLVLKGSVEARVDAIEGSLQALRREIAGSRPCDDLPRERARREDASQADAEMGGGASLTTAMNRGRKRRRTCRVASA